MANTIDLSFSFVALPMALSSSDVPGVPTPVGYRGRFTTTGNDIIQRTSTVTTSPTALDVGSITGAPGLIAIRCSEASAFPLAVYTAVDGAAAKCYCTLTAGQFAVWAPSVTGTVFLKGIGGTATYEYLCIEGAVSGSLTRSSPTVGDANISASVSITATMNSLGNTFSASFTDTLGGSRRINQQFELAEGVDVAFASQVQGYLFALRQFGDADSARLECTTAEVFAELAGLGFAFFPCPAMDAFSFIADSAGDSEIDYVNVGGTGL